MKSILKLFLIISFVHTINCNWNPENYENSNTAQFNYAITELHKLNLKGTEHAIDIGSGDGKVSSYIATHYLQNGTLLGIDNNPSMVDFSQKRISSNLSFSFGDANAYQSEKKFDIVFSFWTLHWVTDYIATLKNIASLLKPGGKTLLCHIRKSEVSLDKTVLELLDLPEWNIYKNNYKDPVQAPSLETIFEAIKQSSLSIENIEIKKNGTWLSISTYKKNLLSTPLFNFLPIEKREKFIDEFIQKQSREETNDKGEIYHWLPVIILVLKK